MNDLAERIAGRLDVVGLIDPDEREDVADVIRRELPPVTPDLRAAAEQASRYVMGLPVAKCGDPIHIPSFEALAAIDIIRDALASRDPEAGS